MGGTFLFLWNNDAYLIEGWEGEGGKVVHS